MMGHEPYNVIASRHPIWHNKPNMVRDKVVVGVPMESWFMSPSTELLQETQCGNGP